MANKTNNANEPTAICSANKEESIRETTNEPVVQYILVRTDLNWTIGAQIAQACHASIASIATTLDSQHTKDYLANLADMHKIILKADKLEELQKYDQRLSEASIPHHLWIEKPENIPTCLAVSPQPKSLVQHLFKHLKLLR